MPRTSLMGILNVTPDSFSDGGRYFDPAAAVARAIDLQQDGAAILDVGGESTRPGSSRISEQEELSRVIPVLERLRLAIPVSIDTRSPAVAAEALRLGATYINCVAVEKDSARTAAIASLAAKSGAQLILTHVRGELEDMHKLPPMRDPVGETFEALRALAASSGLPKEQLLLDPGIGFGKDARESYLLMRNLARFRELGCRLVVGTSRKRFLSSDPKRDQAEDRDFATAATVAILAMQGCDFVRVHNVRAMASVLQVIDKYATIA